MTGDRITYDKMKKRGISTLSIHRILSDVGISVAKRTLQQHLDTEFINCKDSRIKDLVDLVISNHDFMILKFKKMFPDENT